MRRIAAITALVFATLGGNAVAEDSAAPQLTRADVEAWLDGFLPYAMNSGDIAGGVIVHPILFVIAVLSLAAFFFGGSRRTV